MPGAEVASSSAASRRSVAALLFMTSAMTTLDAYSTLNSSPWTAESFGADDRRRTSLREYVRHAVGFSAAYAIVSASIAGSWWPIVGTAVSNVYLVWLYNRAIVRGMNADAKGWANPP